ncbi:MAG: hypothetical protein ACOX9C_06780 [Kiritimatiellia bacterium]
MGEQAADALEPAVLGAAVCRLWQSGNRSAGEGESGAAGLAWEMDGAVECG